MSITVTGQSGKVYYFEKYPFTADFKDTGGVYVIINGEYKPIYIGQTSELGSRMDNHHRYDCFIRNGATHILFMKEGSKNTRLEIESDLINNYNLPCNKK